MHCELIPNKGHPRKQKEGLIELLCSHFTEINTFTNLRFMYAHVYESMEYAAEYTIREIITHTLTPFQQIQSQI